MLKLDCLRGDRARTPVVPITTIRLGYASGHALPGWQNRGQFEVLAASRPLEQVVGAAGAKRRKWKRVYKDRHSFAAVGPGRRGFTLVEIILVLGLLAILAAMAWPSFQSMFEGARLADAASEVRTTLREARRHSIGDGIPYRCDYLAGRGLIRVVPASETLNVEDAASGVGATDQGLDGPSRGAREARRARSDTSKSSSPALTKSGTAAGEGDFEPFRVEIELPMGVRVLSALEFEEGPEKKERSPSDAEEPAGRGDANVPEKEEGWIPLCDLHADGSASPATIRLADRRGMVIELTVDPLTGEVEIGDAMEWVGESDRGEAGAAQNPTNGRGGRP